MTVNLATLGVAIDPTPAQKGADAAAAAFNKVTNAAEKTSAATENASKDAGKNAEKSAKQAESATVGSFAKMLAAVKAYFTGVSSGQAATTKATQQSTAAMKEAATVASGMVGLFTKLATIGGSLAISAALMAAITMGLKFNSLLEDTLIGVAAVQRQFSPEKFNDFASAMKASGEAITLLQKKANESPATFSQLVGAFQATAGAAARANLSMRQHIDLVVMMSQALKGLGIPDQQILTETRALLSGNITQNSDAARILGITSSDIDKATQAGKLFEFLSEKMSAFTEAGKVAGQSLSVQLSNIGDKIQQLAGEVSKPIFEQLRVDASKLLEALSGPAGQATLKQFASSLASMVGTVASFTAVLIRNADTILTAGKYLVGYWLALKAVNFAAFMGGLISTTVAMNQNTAATTANAVAQTQREKAAARNQMLAGGALARGAGAAALVGAFAMGGGAYTAMGVGIGSMFGPWGLAIGAGIGLIADKVSASNEALKEQVSTMTAVTRQLRDQVGNATTLTQQQQARLDVARQLRELEKKKENFPGAGAWAPWEAVQNAFDVKSNRQDAFDALLAQEAELKKLLANPDYMGSKAEDTKAGAEMQAQLERRMETLRKIIDLADTDNAKASARLQLENEIKETLRTRNFVEDQAGALGQNAQLDSLRAYLELLHDVEDQFDAIAGTRQQERAAAELLARDQKAIEKALGDTLKTARAKLSNDTEEIDKLNEKKRIEELSKMDGLDMVKSKAEILKYVKEILSVEKQTREVQAAAAVQEKERAQMLRSADRSLEAARARAAGNDFGADQINTAQLQEELAIARIQLRAVQNEQAIKLRQAGVTGVPEYPTSKDVLGLNSASFGVESQHEALEKLIPAWQAIANMEDALVKAMIALADNSKRIADQVPTDARIMQGLDQQIQRMKAAGMPAEEFGRRADAARDEAAGQITNPKLYQAELGAYRVAMAEKARIAEETDRKIAAGGASMVESLSRGFDMVAQRFGNMQQQAVKLSMGIADSVSNGIGGALGDIVTGSKSASDAWRDMTVQMLNDISRLIIKLLVELAIRQLIAALGGGVSYSSQGVPNGGQVSGFNYSPQAGYIQARATGGYITGGRGGVDDVPAMLTAGEYVLRKDAAAFYGPDFLEALNKRKVQRFAEGGAVAARMANRSAGATGKDGGGSNPITISMDVNIESGGGKSDPNDKRTDRQKAEETARSFRAAIDAWAVENKRAGGLLA